jgi:hypothetical protein
MNLGDEVERPVLIDAKRVIVVGGATLLASVPVAFLAPPVEEMLIEIERVEGIALPSILEDRRKRRL